MRFQRRGRLSSNIEDRRGRGRAAAVGGGGLGIVAVVAFLLVNLLSGGDVDLGGVLSQLEAPAPAGQGESIPTGGEATSDLDEFVSFVLDDVQAFWDEQFAASGQRYDEAVLVLYEGGTGTAGCGYGSATAGPFYCPADRKIYLDQSFFRQLADRFDAPGDFAQAYVLAHEVAHHVQNELGISDRVRAEQQADPDGANELSVALELQADCLAGVWGYAALDADLLEPGDLEEALGAATAVGDDTIQSGAGADVNPETWTHGSAEQRTRWFRTGFESGDPNRCDTFTS
ncbi:neutral zinc metallopeptidase [Euzebya sp.]|uniref:KPN_02809 family neutral zinc metallopeptidase n=1 Tax=Euzebya sp. TaxID=1971409 RepID=UPI0035180415